MPAGREFERLLDTGFRTKGFLGGVAFALVVSTVIALVSSLVGFALALLGSFPAGEMLPFLAVGGALLPVTVLAVSAWCPRVVRGPAAGGGTDRGRAPPVTPQGPTPDRPSGVPVRPRGAAPGLAAAAARGEADAS